MHRVRAVPTLSSVGQQQQHAITAAEAVAGKPSHWDDKKTSYAGRRSRRNSVSDDSQLTIENFGGSQEHLNLIERNPDKDFAVHVGRRLVGEATHAPAPSGPPPAPPEPNLPVRSSLKDSRSNIHIGYDSDGDGNEKQDRQEKESPRLNRQLSSDAISLRHVLTASTVGDQYRPIERSLEQERERDREPETRTEKRTSFAALPNTTTWQLQGSQNHHQLVQATDAHQDQLMQAAANQLMASQLNDIRLKLEEKRKHIENEKKKIELVANKQRQKMGKAAFLQAINKVSALETLLVVVTIAAGALFSLLRLCAM